MKTSSLATLILAAAFVAAESVKWSRAVKASNASAE